MTNVRKVGIAALSLLLVSLGALVAWSGANHARTNHNASVLASGAAAQPSPSPAPTHAPSRVSSRTAATIATATLNPKNDTTPGSPGCGETITKSTQLDTNILDCPNDGLIVGASNITIDLAGFTVAGRKTDHSAGIRNAKGYSGVTIRGGTVRGFDTGIVVAERGAKHNTLTDLTVSGNHNGIILSQGPFNEVNDVTLGDNDEAGIKVESDSNKILNNDIANSRPGILIAGNSNTLAENSVDGGGNAIAGAGDKNTLVENDLRGGAGGGIVLLGSSNTISNNDVKDFGSVGIWLQQTTAATPTPTPTPTPTGNSTDTAVQRSPSHSATKADTTVKRAKDNAVRDNDVVSNGHGGILVDSDSSTIDSNSSLRNTGDGIATRGSNPLITDNDANGNTGHGIIASGGARGSGNSANGNGQGGCSPSELCD